MTASLRQAAIVLKCLRTEDAALLLNQLSAPQAQAVVGEMGRLDEPHAEARALAVRQFLAASQRADERLVARLRGERPQTQAIVLACLPRRRASALLARFPEAERVRALGRMQDLRLPSAELLRQIELGLDLPAGTLQADAQSAESARSLGGI